MSEEQLALFEAEDLPPVTYWQLMGAWMLGDLEARPDE